MSTATAPLGMVELLVREAKNHLEVVLAANALGYYESALEAQWLAKEALRRDSRGVAQAKSEAAEPMSRPRHLGTLFPLLSGSPSLQIHRNLGITLAMRIELESTGIKVNAASPGHKQMKFHTWSRC